MKIEVTPVCVHQDGWMDHGESFKGSHVIVGAYGVYLDGVEVIHRDRRVKRNRVPGHPWLARSVPYTSFRVSVEP